MTVGSSNPSEMRKQPRQVRSQQRVARILDVAEEQFIAQGYAATTTKAIATQAKVSIGSLYQFFPDKAAILQALAMRYGELLRQRLAELTTDEIAQLSLADYVEQLVDATNQFFLAYPGYHAIFMEVQGTVPDLEKIEDAVDAQLVDDLAAFLSRRDSALAWADCEAIAFVLVKAVGTLLWLSLSQESSFQQRLVSETKRLTLTYLKSYLSSPQPNQI